MSKAPDFFWVLNKTKEKWKTQCFLCNQFCIIFFFLLQLPLQSVRSQTWDGVFVTQSNYEGLQAFKNELIDPSGILQSWNDTGSGACSGRWKGIKCAQGQVIVIQLPWKGLGGQISEKIGQLTALRKLNLHDNFIGGMIPTTLGFLPNLRGLQLFNNQLTGSIPPSIGSCPLLQTLDLSHNSLTGTIPATLTNSTVLYRLNLSFNALSGSIPVSLTHSPSLIFLALQFNNLSGTIPESIDGLQKLSVLDLSRNQFKGHIPASLGNITSLTQLDLSHNGLAGDIPDSLIDLSNLVSFNLSFNNLSGSVPSPLSTQFNSSSFMGNPHLCGYRVSNPCPSSSPSESLPALSPEDSVSEPRGRRKLSTKDIILIGSGALLGVLLLLCGVLLCCLIRKKGASKGKNNGHRGGVAGSGEKGRVTAIATEAEAGGDTDTGGKLVHFDGPLMFTADDLLCATAEIMGKSTYGTIYKATLEDGSQVAVKRLREKIAKSQKEFQEEVTALGKIRHQNLLALRAYYLGPKGEKLLVFDFMPRGSLAAFLHARGPETPIDWPTRMNIAIGISRGLCNLHNQENIVHGNLTAGNILLDEQTNARIADYGLSKLMTTTANSTVIATAASLGYRAPELSKVKNVSTKTDVYSLGMIMLELLTGKSPGEAGVDLPQWVASIVNEEWTNEVFDLELMKDANSGDELLNTLKLALLCVDPSPAARPEVQQVLQQLEEIKPEMPMSSSDNVL